jgi:hypothetical protein
VSTSNATYLFIYLFTYGLFIDANFDYMTSNGMTFSEQLTGKPVGGYDRGLVLSGKTEVLVH